MGKIVVLGSSNTDMVVTTSKIPLPGETVLGNEFDVIPGGKGANQAVAAARAGGEVTFIAKVGDDDFGRQAIEGYAKDRINTDAIFINNKKPSGIALIIVNETSGQNSIVVAPGANALLSVDDLKKVAPVIASADILLVQLEIPLDTVVEGLRIAKKNNVKTILNPAPAQNLNDEILNLVDIITPNEIETEMLIGIKPFDELSANRAAALLLGKVNDSVLVTMGEKGAYYLSENNKGILIPAMEVEAVDTTAAGDVFNGYLAAALANGKPAIKAVEQANKAAAISVTRKGAQPSIPELEEI